MESQKEISRFKIEAGVAAGGSNCWVVHGNHTESGKPLLACDPHVTKTMSNLFYSVRLSWKDPLANDKAYIAGANLVGTPSMFYGRSAYGAFGCTAINPDVTDLFSETIEGNKYLYDG